MHPPQMCIRALQLCLHACYTEWSWGWFKIVASHSALNQKNLFHVVLMGSVLKGEGLSRFCPWAEHPLLACLCSPSGLSLQLGPASSQHSGWESLDCSHAFLQYQEVQLFLTWGRWVTYLVLGIQSQHILLRLNLLLLLCLKRVMWCIKVFKNAKPILLFSLTASLPSTYSVQACGPLRVECVWNLSFLLE